MTTRTFTLLVTITDEPGSQLFDTTTLADVVAGALETGITCVVKGVPDVNVPSVEAASADAVMGDWLHDRFTEIKGVHRSLHD